MRIPTHGDENEERNMFHNNELHSSYGLHNNATVIKTGVLRRTGHIARMVELTSSLNISKVNTTGSRYTGSPTLMRNKYWKLRIL